MSVIQVSYTILATLEFPGELTNEGIEDFAKEYAEEQGFLELCNDIEYTVVG